jgi:hypothetical protein
MLWRFPAECAAATGAAISDAPAAAYFVSPADAAALGQALNRALVPLKTLCLAFDEALLGHLFVAERQARDIRRAEPQNIFERVAHFAEIHVHAEALE